MTALTDQNALNRNRQRHLPEALFLHRQAITEVQDRLSMVNRTFCKTAIVSGFPTIWQAAFESARLIADHDTLALLPDSCDLVIHAMALHWADDMVGQLIQCRRALTPDGLFLAVCFGGQTLWELRAALTEAEIEIAGGLSPRIAPMAEIRDLGGLLQRAGFALPVADSTRLTVTYPSARHLMRELRAMGENNALDSRLRHPTPAAVLHRAEAIYSASHGRQDGTIAATFEMIYLTGWAPDASQPKPLRPGSALTRLSSALKTPENPLKD